VVHLVVAVQDLVVAKLGARARAGADEFVDVDLAAVVRDGAALVRSNSRGLKP